MIVQWDRRTVDRVERGAPLRRALSRSAAILASMGEHPPRDGWGGDRRFRSVFLAVLAVACLATGRWWWVANDPGPGTSAGVAARSANAGTAPTTRAYRYVPESEAPIVRFDPSTGEALPDNALIGGDLWRSVVDSLWASAPAAVT